MRFARIPLCPDGTIDLRRTFGANFDFRTQRERDWYIEALWRARVKLREMLPVKRRPRSDREMFNALHREIAALKETL